MPDRRPGRGFQHFQLLLAVPLLLADANASTALAQVRDQAFLPTNDAVVARVYEHNGGAPRPLVLVVDRSNFPAHVWERVQDLVAFRLHRHRPDGTTIVDAPIYMVRNSALYLKAVAALEHGATNQEYLWCQLAAVLAHEAAHVTPSTERQALLAEAEQLRRCLLAGHMHTSTGWSAGAYLQNVEARLRQPREHY